MNLILVFEVMSNMDVLLKCSILVGLFEVCLGDIYWHSMGFFFI